jgi:hypothetical protein
MNSNPRDWIDRHFDGDLSEQEHAEFQAWLRSSASHAAEFARTALLHDRIRAELLASDVVSAPQPMARRSIVPSTRSIAMWAATLASVLILLSLWIGFGGTSVSAATELNRLIAAQLQSQDRKYQIDVEEVAVPDQVQHRLEADRPPKPPLNGAVLYVRRGNQFVLIRETPEGAPFVTGSNGQTSWAVKPDGSVRFSRDLTRFNRDLPGHEHDIPLIHLEDGLSQLKAAYDIQLLPIEAAPDGAATEEATRLLVAVKKRGERGPRRVEITYAVESGHIRQLRFVEMPYGPERLTLRMTLLEEQNQGPGFFDHPAHHAPDRHVQEE